ncbi:hypothetical protein V6N11_038352 [Hibiscus sabdariffa]|uniref:RecA-like N-terminal domain-containing protein n=1 Tax=Hibiscus sabdariffa TaxID=183260 RepID=A0ABR2SJP5_9ROSI
MFEDMRLGSNAMLVDAEHSFDPAYSKALGVDVGNLIVCRPDNGYEVLIDIYDGNHRDHARNADSSVQDRRWNGTFYLNSSSIEMYELTSLHHKVNIQQQRNSTAAVSRGTAFRLHVFCFQIRKGALS